MSRCVTAVTIEVGVTTNSRGGFCARSAVVQSAPRGELTVSPALVMAPVSELAYLKGAT